MWAIARIDLRLTDTEFYGMAPAMFDLLACRIEAHERIAMTRSAWIRAELYNVNGASKDREPFTAADFLPETVGERRSRLHAEEMAKLPPSPEQFAAWKAGLTQTIHSNALERERPARYGYQQA